MSNKGTIAKRSERCENSFWYPSECMLNERSDYSIFKKTEPGCRLPGSIAFQCF